MATPRTWSMRFNLDAFNAGYAALDDDSDKAQFLTGFSRGLNGGNLKEGVSGSLSDGFQLGHEMRQEAEAFRAQASVHGKKGGKPKGTPGDTPKGMDGDTGNPNHKPQTTIPKSTKPKSSKPSTSPKAPLSLREILGDRGNDYFDLVKLFGNGKNTNAKTSAVLYLKALGEFTHEHIYQKAKNYTDSVSDPKYVCHLAKWLSEESYRNPDCPILRPKSTTSRAHDADRSFMDQLESRYLADNPEFFQEEVHNVAG